MRYVQKILFGKLLKASFNKPLSGSLLFFSQPFLAAVAVIPLLLVLSALEVSAFPNYDLEVRVNYERHTISGRLKVSLPLDDPRPGDFWWFHLPPNRFIAKDSRGGRRIIGTVPIGLKYTEPNRIDPMFPEGFSKGWIDITSARDDAGRELTYSFQDNTEIPKGFSPDKGLLKVAFHPESSGREVTLNFVTRLPNRHWEGWNDTGIFTERWHPVLLISRHGDWQRDPFALEAAYYQGWLEINQAGWIQAGREPAQLIQPGKEVFIPPQGEPVSSVPLVFMKGPQLIIYQGSKVKLKAFFFGEETGVAALALSRGAGFIEYMSQVYQIEPPGSDITLVQSDLPLGEIWSAGNTIFIPTVFFLNSPILDRVFVAKLARAISEIWFGNTLLANLDKQAWIQLGLTSFFALEFYEYLYGWDANIHELIDWLSPRYREHYLEALVLKQFRNNRATPLDISLFNSPSTRDALVSIFHKTPLVIRSLKYLMGDDKFQRGIRIFYQQNRHGLATVKSFQKAMEEANQAPLQEYFNQYFHNVTLLDYELKDWRESRLEDKYKVEVDVVRKEAGVLPVEIHLLTEDGSRYVKKIDGKAASERVEFLVNAPVMEIALDPDEFLLETNRQNNYSSRAIRLRPIWDWSKEKETLITVVGRLGGNAIDGNFLGLGANIKFDHENQLSIIPIDGQKNNELLYEISYLKNHFIWPSTDFKFHWKKLGGQRSIGPGLVIMHYGSDYTEFFSTIEFRLEEVESAPAVAATANLLQEAGKTNNIYYEHNINFTLDDNKASDFHIAAEHSQPVFGSDIDYTTLFSVLGHSQMILSNHSLRMELLRGMVRGDPPIQKQHLLGDPLALRGFPRTINLVYDNIIALRSEYRYVITRNIYGKTFQTRKIDFILFYDVGKGWNNNDDYDEALTRKDAGIGINFDINTLSMLEFPLRLEIAWPINDPEYKREQFIFFQALSFF